MSTVAPRIVIPLTVLVVSGLIAAYLIGSRPHAKPTPPAERVRVVNVIPARYETVRPNLTAYGEIAAGREAEVRPMVSGRLVFLHESFRDGGKVLAGTRIAAIDRFDYEIAQREANADRDEALGRLAELRSELKIERQRLSLIDEQVQLRQRDLERIKNLITKGQSSEKALDDARLQSNEALQQRLATERSISTLEARVSQQLAAVERNEARVARAERDLADTDIVAPFTGFVQDVVLALGKRIDTGESIGRLIDSVGLEVRFELPNSDYARLVGKRIPATGDGNSNNESKVEVIWRLGDATYHYDALLERTAAEVDSTTGGVVLYARIVAGPVDILRPGAFVEVTLADAKFENIIALPATAISDDNTIYVIEESRLVPSRAEVVRRFGNQVLVRTDVPENIAIVTEQFAGIGPGILVDAMTEGPESD